MLGSAADPLPETPLLNRFGDAESEPHIHNSLRIGRQAVKYAAAPVFVGGQRFSACLKGGGMLLVSMERLTLAWMC